MSRPLEKIAKEYSSRGPLKQFRFERSISFNCIRCTEQKTAKLVTIYYNDWSRKICNGCYGRLLSIVEIKANDQNIEEKVSALVGLFDNIISNNDLLETKRRLLLLNSKAQLLSNASQRLLATSDFLAKSLSEKDDLEWSGAIICLCKTVENEIVIKLVDKLRDKAINIDIPPEEFKDAEFGKIVKYCKNQSAKPPELGTFAFFLQSAINSKTRKETSTFLKEVFIPLMNRMPNSSYLIDKKGLCQNLFDLTNNFRNKAAHIEELNKEDYELCSALVLGKEGILWEFLFATS